MSYITPNEIDGKIQDKLLKTYNRFIGALRSVFHIHMMRGGTHTPKSYHYLGMAGDGHMGDFRGDRRPTDMDVQIIADNLQKLINKEDKTLFEQAIIAKLAGFNGIGMYPHWTPTGGLHCDIRPYSVAWIGIDKEEAQRKILKSKTNKIYIYLK